MTRMNLRIFGLGAVLLAACSKTPTASGLLSDSTGVVHVSVGNYTPDTMKVSYWWEGELAHVARAIPYAAYTSAPLCLAFTASGWAQFEAVFIDHSQPNGVVATAGSSLLTAPFNPKGVPYWQVVTFSVSGNPFNVGAVTVDSAYYHTSGGC